MRIFFVKRDKTFRLHLLVNMQSARAVLKNTYFFFFFREESGWGRSVGSPRGPLCHLRLCTSRRAYLRQWKLKLPATPLCARNVSSHFDCLFAAGKRRQMQLMKPFSCDSTHCYAAWANIAQERKPCSKISLPSFFFSAPRANSAVVNDIYVTKEPRRNILVLTQPRCEFGIENETPTLGGRLAAKTRFLISSPHASWHARLRSFGKSGLRRWTFVIFWHRNQPRLCPFASLRTTRVK